MNVVPYDPRRLFVVILLGFLSGAGVGVWSMIQLRPHPPVRLEATVYLPIQDNDGRRFPDELWNKALEQLILVCGGATFGPETEGCWLNDEGKVIREPIRTIFVSFDRQQLPEFRSAVHRIAVILQQDAMYVRYEEKGIELIDRK